MKNFDRTELWSLLRHPDTCVIIDADVALHEFATELHSYCRAERDLAQRTRTLRFTRSGLTLSHHEAGEKSRCPTPGRKSRRPDRLRAGDRPHGARPPGTIRASNHLQADTDRSMERYHCPTARSGRRALVDGIATPPLRPKHEPRRGRQAVRSAAGHPME